MRYTSRQPVGLVMYVGPRVEGIEIATGSSVVVHLADGTTREWAGLPACLQFYGIAQWDLYDDFGKRLDDAPSGWLST